MSITLIRRFCSGTLGQAILVGILQCTSLCALGQRDANAAAKDFTFDVVSVRETAPQFGGTGITPDGYRAMQNLEYMIKWGYGIGIPAPKGDRTQVINLPGWASHTYYQIDARVAPEDIKAWQSQGHNPDLLRSAMRQLLIERFHLKLHVQQVQRDGYRLLVRPKGIKFKAAPRDSTAHGVMVFLDGGTAQQGQSSAMSHPMHFYKASMEDLATYLNLFSDRPIFDSTGLTGRYDFTLERTDDVLDTADGQVRRFLIQSLGLQLKPGRGLGGVNIIVDHVDKPTPN